MAGSLTLTCGLPGSGKTEWAKSLCCDGWVRVCPDEVRYALLGQQYRAESEPLVWAIVELMVRTQLADDRDVVLDATNLTAKRRKQWINIALAAGIPAYCYAFTAPFETCVARQGGRPERERIDPFVIARMHGEYEPPTEAEGFNWVYDLGEIWNSTEHTE